MAELANASLERVLRDVVQLFEGRQLPYLIIGGMAQAVIGEPRLTQDVDCIIAVQPAGIDPLLAGFERSGFEVDRGAVHRCVEATGTFGVRRGRWRVDLIVASTDFEQSAFRRAQRFRLYDVEMNFPTPEDLILLKLVPGRDKDLLDAKTVAIRHRSRLDRAYLEHWAQWLSDEAQDGRVWQTLQQLLKEADAVT